MMKITDLSHYSK